MRVEIHTDAAYNQEFMVGAYAYWINYPEGQIIKSGILKGLMANPTEAEVKCIANALIDFHRILGMSNKVRELTIFTDCKPAISLIQSKDSKNKSLAAMQARDSCNKCIDSLLFKGFGNYSNKGVIQFEHVPGHTNNEGKNSDINRWLDLEAKKWMVQRIQTFVHLPDLESKPKGRKP